MTLSITPRELARIFGGDVTGRGAVVPGPGHSTKDRSLSIVLGKMLPDGFLVHSHAGDDSLQCRDYVRAKLGLEPFRPERPTEGQIRPSRRPVLSTRSDDEARKHRAIALWQESDEEPQRTLAERYWREHRGGLTFGPDVAGRVLRFHPGAPWKDDDGEIIKVPCMVAALRSISTDEITGVQLTRLDPRTGQKIDRRMRGVARGSAIKLDDDAEVTHGLFIGEGCETVQTHREHGLRPAWALGSADAIAKFPALAGIDCITLIGERDTNGRNEQAIDTCAQRWLECGREVWTIDPPEHAKDANDVLQRRRS